MSLPRECRSWRFRCLTVSALILAGGIASPAQTSSTGALLVVVQDTSGGVMAGVTVSLANESTGERRAGVTGGLGQAIFAFLQPGTYRVACARPGFETRTTNNLRVELAQTAQITMSLEVSKQTEAVEIAGAAEMARSDSPALGKVTDGNTLATLPLVTRNYVQALTLSPGITASVSNAAQIGQGGGLPVVEGSSDGIFAHGARSYDNNFQMDGVSISDVQGTGNASGFIAIPNPDAIGEFRVQTALYDAGYGRFAGANVNVVTRSGTNGFHGTLFGFFRNEALNANGFFQNAVGSKRPVLRQDQLGAVAGGPIAKNKLLAFLSYQHTGQSNGLSTGQARVACQSYVNLPPLSNDRSQATLGRMFGGMQGAFGGAAIRPDGSNINPVALTLLNFRLPGGGYLIPTPQAIDTSRPLASQGVYSASDPCHYQEDQGLANFDLLATDRSRVGLRTFAANSSALVTFPGGGLNAIGNTAGFPSTISTSYRNAVLSHTYLLSPLWLSEFRFGYVGTRATTTADAPFQWSSVGVAEGSMSGADALPSLIIAGSVRMASAFPRTIEQNTGVVSEDVSYARGKVTLRLGGGLLRLSDQLWQTGLGSALQFQSWPDFLLGLSAAGNGSPFSNIYSSIDSFGLLDRHYVVWDANLYSQLDLRVSQGLTLNAGLRYERLGRFGDHLGRDASFDLAQADPNPPPTGSTAGYVVASNFSGALPPGVSRSSNLAANRGDVNTVSPRLGFAWRTPLRQLIVRGGYGIYSSRSPGQAHFQNVFGAPFAVPRVSQGGDNAAASFQTPFAQPFPTPGSFPSFPAYSPSTSITISSVSPTLRSARLQQFGFSAQTELARNTLLEIGYTGSRGDHLMRTLSLNQAQLASPSNPIRGQISNTLANVRDRVRVQGIASGALLLVDAGGESWYNDLEANLTRRYASGLAFSMSYTWSKTLDTDAANIVASSGGTQASRGNQYDERQRRGRASFDRTHRLVFNGSYAIPSRASASTFLRAATSGWQISGVATVQSGMALSILYANAASVYGINQDRAQFAPGCTAGDLIGPGSTSSRLTNYFNRSCFTRPLVIGSDGIATDFGNSGSGIATGPGQMNVDLAVVKSFSLSRLRGDSAVELRAELFNAMNTAQFANPDNAFSSPTFGVIVATSVNPRVVQLALKFKF